MNPTYNALGQPVGPLLSDWTPPPHPPHKLLEGRFCRVEPLDPGRHAEDLHMANSADSAGRMWTYLPYGPFATLDDYRAWAEHACRSNDRLVYAIVDNTTGRAGGVANYLRIDPPAGSIEVGGLAFAPVLQRTPAATEAMILMMRNVFALGYRRYEWKCDALNVASRAAAQRLGFAFEGMFRQALVVRGRNRDTAWYAVIDAEWPQLADAFERWLDPANFDADGRQRSSLSALTAPLLYRRG